MRYQAMCAILLSLTLMTPVTTRAKDLAGEHPFTTFHFKPLRNGCPLVQVMLINEKQTAHFLFDTGFNRSSITGTLADKLGLVRKPAISTDGHPIQWQGRPMDYVAVSRLQIGMMTYEQIPLVVLDSRDVPALIGESVDGMLGANAFSHYPVLFDFARQQITLWSAGRMTEDDLKAAGMADAVALPLLPSPEGSPEFYVRVKLNEKVEENLMVDTGSAISFISPSAARRLKLQPVRQVKDYRSFTGLCTLNLARLNTLSLGKVSVADLEVGYEEKAPTTSMPILGMDVLSRFRVLIDVPGKKMYLQPCPVEPEPGKKRP